MYYPEKSSKKKELITKQQNNRVQNVNQEDKLGIKERHAAVWSNRPSCEILCPSIAPQLWPTSAFMSERVKKGDVPLYRSTIRRVLLKFRLSNLLMPTSSFWHYYQGQEKPLLCYSMLRHQTSR